MTHPRELIALVTRLRKSGQPLKQVRLLLKLWKAVDEVPKRERGRLLRRLGMEGGEDLIHKFLGSGGRLDPELAAAALQLLDGLSAKRVRAFTGSHMSAKETEQVLAMLKGALRQQAGDAAPAAESSGGADDDVEPPPSAEPYVRRRRIPLVDPDLEIEDVVEIASEVVDSALGTESVAAAAPATGAAAAAAVSAAASSAARESAEDAGGQQEKTEEPEEVAARPEPEVEPRQPEAAAERRQPESPPDTRPEPEPRTKAAPLPEPPAQTPTRQPELALPAPAVEKTGPGTLRRSPDWLDALQAVATPVSRLLAYRRLEEGIDHLSRAQVRDLVNLFPAGWMRRRVLQSVFRKGMLSSGEAADLLAELQPTPVTYLWLAGSLLDRPDLPATDRETLIEQAPSATIKRLLEARSRA